MSSRGCISNFSRSHNFWNSNIFRDQGRRSAVILDSLDIVAVVRLGILSVCLWRLLRHLQVLLLLFLLVLQVGPFAPERLAFGFLIARGLVFTERLTGLATGRGIVHFKPAISVFSRHESTTLGVHIVHQLLRQSRFALLCGNECVRDLEFEFLQKIQNIALVIVGATTTTKEDCAEWMKTRKQ